MSTVEYYVPIIIRGSLQFSQEHLDALGQITGCNVTRVSQVQKPDEQLKKPITIVEFTVNQEGDPKSDQFQDAAYANAKLLVTRFAGLLAFCMGRKEPIQKGAIRIPLGDGKWVAIGGPGTVESRVNENFSIPESFLRKQVLSPELFASMFWLRRGLSQDRDAIERFGNLMVAVQIVARQIVQLPGQEIRCPNCRELLKESEPSVTSQVKELLITHLKRDEEEFRALWKARNAVSAHGNAEITPDLMKEVTKLMFTAIEVTYSAIQLAIGIPLDKQKRPSNAVFMTDAFIYYD